MNAFVCVRAWVDGVGGRGGLVGRFTPRVHGPFFLSFISLFFFRVWRAVLTSHASRAWAIRSVPSPVVLGFRV